MARRAASTAARGSACRSAGRSHACWAARSRSTAPPGEGTTFTLLLPTSATPTPVVLAPVERLADPVVRAAHAERTAELAGHRVLVVDDDVRNVYALTSALEDHGMEVVCASSGKRGLELLDSTPG